VIENAPLPAKAKKKPMTLAMVTRDTDTDLGMVTRDTDLGMVSVKPGQPVEFSAEQVWITHALNTAIEAQDKHSAPKSERSSKYGVQEAHVKTTPTLNLVAYAGGLCQAAIANAQINKRTDMMIILKAGDADQRRRAVEMLLGSKTTLNKAELISKLILYLIAIVMVFLLSSAGKDILLSIQNVTQAIYKTTTTGKKGVFLVTDTADVAIDVVNATQAAVGEALYAVGDSLFSWRTAAKRIPVFGRLIGSGSHMFEGEEGGQFTLDEDTMETIIEICMEQLRAHGVPFVDPLLVTR